VNSGKTAEWIEMAADFSVFDTDSYLLACTAHIWKCGGYKKLIRSLRSRITFYPSTFKIAALPLHQYHLHTKVAAITVAT